MSRYEVKPIVCDYGLYENGNLILICNSKWNADLIKAIMDKDSLCNRKPYVFHSQQMGEFILSQMEKRGSEDDGQK